MHQQKQPFKTSTDPNVKGRMQNMTGQVTSNRLLHCYVTGSLTVEKGYSTQKTTNNMGALSDKISCAVAMDYVIPRSRFTSGYKLQTVKSNKKNKKTIYKILKLTEVLRENRLLQEQFFSIACTGRQKTIYFYLRYF